MASGWCITYNGQVSSEQRPEVRSNSLPRNGAWEAWMQSRILATTPAGARGQELFLPRSLPSVKNVFTMEAETANADIKFIIRDTA